MVAGFFTKGVAYELPHPKIQHRILLIICKVIRRAWQLLEKYPPSEFSLQSADEKAITQMLIETVENRLRKTGEVPGFNSKLFGRVSRDQKITNYDKEHPDKMPDILFDLKREKLPILSEHDGLFAECKPVDSAHPVFSCYCKDGLIRFVNGDYAWAMQDAMMIGYATKPYSFKKLASELDDGKSAFLNTIDHKPIDHYGIYRSRHDRNFEWLENRGKAFQITICHLWLPVPNF